jgi:hypothetical protein
LQPVSASCRPVAAVEAVTTDPEPQLSQSHKLLVVAGQRPSWCLKKAAVLKVSLWLAKSQPKGGKSACKTQAKQHTQIQKKDTYHVNNI